MLVRRQLLFQTKYLLNLIDKANLRCQFAQASPISHWDQIFIVHRLASDVRTKLRIVFLKTTKTTKI